MSNVTAIGLESPSMFSARTVRMGRVGGVRGSPSPGHELAIIGHDVWMIPPKYVKPLVKRHKNVAVDAEAICEAAQRPRMRFVAEKSEGSKSPA